MSTAELAASYAALILADDGVEITADKLTTLVKAAGVNEFEPIWATLFAKVGEIPFLAQELEEAADEDETDKPQALEGKDVKSMLLNVGSGGGAAAAPAAGGAAAAGGAEAAEETKEEEAKEEEKEESDEDMGFGLFD